VATLHATTPAGALARLDRLAQRANVPPQAALVAEAIDWIVMVAGGASSDAGRARRVTDVARVRGLDGLGRFVIERSPSHTEAQCDLALG
jgi:type IV secretion system protein VirB11